MYLETSDYLLLTVAILVYSNKIFMFLTVDKRKIKQFNVIVTHFSSEIQRH